MTLCHGKRSFGKYQVQVQGRFIQQGQGRQIRKGRKLQGGKRYYKEIILNPDLHYIILLIVNQDMGAAENRAFIFSAYFTKMLNLSKAIDTVKNMWYNLYIKNILIT